jgi:hypothetical protein
MIEELCSIRLSPEFVKEFNGLEPEVQDKTLNVMKRIMRNPSSGEKIKGPFELEHIADEKDFPEGKMAEG